LPGLLLPLAHVFALALLVLLDALLVLLLTLLLELAALLVQLLALLIGLLPLLLQLLLLLHLLLPLLLDLLTLLLLLLALLLLLHLLLALLLLLLTVLRERGRACGCAEHHQCGHQGGGFHDCSPGVDVARVPSTTPLPGGAAQRQRFTRTWAIRPVATAISR
jgi:hypothetical protein